LINANLSGASLGGVNLSEADLQIANLSQAILWGANLGGANLEFANLSRAMYWTVEQLEQADVLGGATMPDEVRLGLEETEYRGCIEGPTFEEWKAHYLAEHGGTTTDLRNTEWAK
jgi:hypothetical protein